MQFRLLAFALLSVRVTATTQPLVITAEQLHKVHTAECAPEENGFTIRLDDPAWKSGARITPPSGQMYWDFSRYHTLAADITNLLTDKQIRLNMILSSGDRDKTTFREAIAGIALNPGEQRTIRLPLNHAAQYAVPEGVPGRTLLATDQINAIEFCLQWPFEVKQRNFLHCRITNIRLEGALTNAQAIPPENFFPFVDRYGQYRHTEWPEKIHTDDDLKRNLATERKQLAQAARPADWNAYGGWAKGPRLKATGHFRTEKYNGKWYLVDPSGALFFSLGLDVLYPYTDATQVDGHTHWFEGVTQQRGKLPFPHWNLQKKYGQQDYTADFFQDLTKRLTAWGINTIGDWGSKDFIALGTMPYTLQITDYSAKLPTLKDSKLKFYDVFDERYIHTMTNMLIHLAAKDPVYRKSLTDPLCIGYFIDNELDFGNRGTSYIEELLKCPSTQPSKVQFIADQRQRYTTIDQLNQAWDTHYTDWDALLVSTQKPDTPGFKSDAKAFHQKAVDQYFRLCRGCIKNAAPHRLYLGPRFVSTDGARPLLYQPSAQYCDVLTVNVYSHSCANFATAIKDFPDMPVLIGEFHFGIYDRGMFKPGLCLAGTTPSDRALAYTRFMQGALTHPNIVGAHWFQFRDQPLTGRFDGEGYQIGFVDVADTPYPTLTHAARQIAEAAYTVRAKGQ